MGTFAGSPWLLGPATPGLDNPTARTQAEPVRRVYGRGRAAGARLLQTAAATPTLVLPAPPFRGNWQRPHPHAARAKSAQSGEEREDVSNSLGFAPQAPDASRPRFSPENSFPSREGQGPRGGSWVRSRPSLATPLPRRCGPRRAKSFLPGRSVKVGGRGHVTVLRPWRARLRPSRPHRSAGHLAKTHRPQPRASPVAAARPQSHRQVQAQPRRERVEPSR